MKLEICGYLLIIMINIWASQAVLVVKNLLANAGEIKDTDAQNMQTAQMSIL